MRDLNVECIEKDLCGDFWTDLEEMVDDIKEAGYEVEDYNDEYIAIRESEDDDAQPYILYLGHANKTIWIDSIKEMAF